MFIICYAVFVNESLLKRLLILIYLLNYLFTNDKYLRIYGFLKPLHLNTDRPVFETTFFNFSKTTTMKTDTILQADVLDIIFDNRNKNYGAYDLRKHYDERLFKALGFTFLISVVFYSFTFIHKKENIILNVTPDIIIAKAMPNTEKILPPKMPEKARQASIQHKVNSQIWVNKVIIIPNDSLATKLSDNLDNVRIDNKTETGVPAGNSKTITSTEGLVENISGTDVTKKIDKEKTLLTAEIMPAYPGGMDALRKFLEKNLHNPQGLDEGQTVSVKIKFVVGYDGNLKGFETVEDGGKAFNNEVVRVLKKMPAWTPGKSNGENVAVYFTIPVKFVAE